MPVLQKDETITATTVVRASPQTVYRLVSDVTRIPEWSPETVRVQWVSGDRFRAWNRRRLGRWRTESRVVEAVPDQRFSFIVEAMGGDWTQWSFTIEPGPGDGTVHLTEECRMCVALPFGVVVFEHLALFVRDRRADLQDNLKRSLERIRALAEAQK
ncbi:MAG: SRPBCC family protein [Actinomycetota bacterium]|nr:SRPBCC family protein [Actinomycetota bacterium]